MDFDVVNVEAASFFAEAMAEFRQAYMQGREYAQEDINGPVGSDGRGDSTEEADIGY